MSRRTRFISVRSARLSAAVRPLATLVGLKTSLRRWIWLTRSNDRVDRAKSENDSRPLHVMDGSIAGDYVSQPHRLRFTLCGKRLNDAIGVPLGADDDQADSHVENTVHLVGRNAAPLLKETEQRRVLPRAPIDLGRAPFRQRTRHIFGDAAPGDVREAFDETALDE